jgi:hypothetical protein
MLITDSADSAKVLGMSVADLKEGSQRFKLHL